jgi:TolA-binding protein
MTQSVSFRITRTAEDVAQAINALSQRLVKLEQRLDSLELQVKQQQSSAEMPAEDLARLDDVDRLLLDCQSLLQSTVDADALPVDSGTEGFLGSADEDSEDFKAA